MFCVGIDPGTNGGIAIIDSEKLSIIAHKMPETTADIYHLLSQMPASKCKIILESQHARPSYRQTIRIDESGTPYKTNIPVQGSVAAWTFAQHYGELRGILTACCLSFDELSPRDWMKAAGIRKKNKAESQTEWKNFLKGKAQEMYPGVRVTLAVADALLIAGLCHRLYGSRGTIPDPWDDI